MGTPYHISRSSSQLLSCDEASAELQALSLIAESLEHPQRTLLASFLQGAVDRELASRFFLNEVFGHDKATVTEFLADWVRLLRKVRPAICEKLDVSLRRSIWRRDEGKCCISKAAGNWKKYDGGPLIIHILPPTLFQDEEMIQGGRLYTMFAAYIRRPKLECLSLLLNHDSYSPNHGLSDQLMLLSPHVFEHFANGRLSLKANPRKTSNNSAQYFVKKKLFIPCSQVNIIPWVTFENRAMDSSSLPNPQLIEVHDQLAPALAWLEVYEYMRRACNSSCGSTSQDPVGSAAKVPANKSWIQQHIQSVSQALQYLWLQTPICLRVSAYKFLAFLGRRFYAHTGSERIHRLPFNLYLRIASEKWAQRHQAELQSLYIVEKHTSIPAPKGIEAVQHRGSSYLLMTGVPGRGIGQMLATMTDKQVDVVAQDLKNYIAELRQIPNKTASGFQICNPLGGGILDWRIGDSQRKQLKFHDEAEFNQFLTHDLPLDEDAWERISKSHDVKHNIVFTHADLNLRNILVDKKGRISGIVDWECAGWYPEYWEYTKMHFTVRVTLRWIADVVHQIFPGYRDELDAENTLTCMAPSF